MVVGVLRVLSSVLEASVTGDSLRTFKIEAKPVGTPNDGCCR